MHMKIVLLILIFNINVILGANILFVSDSPLRSHQLWNYEIVLGLLAKGHNVTNFGTEPLKGEGQTNYHTINMEGLQEAVDSEMDFTQIESYTIYQAILFSYDWSFITCEHVMKNKGLQTLLDYPKDAFDLIIFDYTPGPCTLPLIQWFNYPPAVGVTGFLLPYYLSESFGNDVQPAYVPFYWIEFDERPTFFQRLQNNLWLKFDSAARFFYVNRRLEATARETFGTEMESLRSLESHVSLLLCNIIPGYHYSQAVTPNIIPVGGLHINPGNKKLPADLQKILDDAKNGVILFALGTNVKPSVFNETKITAFLETFRQLKQTVLWKFDGELENLPKNVIVRKWLPQREILEHPNIKLFISHGGALSTMEATYFGVPVIGIPFFADQIMNIRLMKQKKLAIHVKYSTLTSKILLDSIKEVLNNPIYKDNVKKMSEIIKDQPQKPLDRAIFWIEYALRHNGSHHLDPASRYMPLIFTMSLDVYFFVLFIIVVLIAALLKIVNFIRAICKHSSSKSSKKLKLK